MPRPWLSPRNAVKLLNKLRLKRSTKHVDRPPDPFHNEWAAVDHGASVRMNRAQRREYVRGLGRLQRQAYGFGRWRYRTSVNTGRYLHPFADRH